MATRTIHAAISADSVDLRCRFLRNLIAGFLSRSFPKQRSSSWKQRVFWKKGRPRKGDQRGTKPRSRPLAPIGGSSAAHFRVITRCINETYRCFDSRFSMSEFGQSALTRFSHPSSPSGRTPPGRSGSAVPGPCRWTPRHKRRRHRPRTTCFPCLRPHTASASPRRPISRCRA